MMLIKTSGISAEELKISLLDGWQFKQADASEWLPAQVPGTVHTDLLANGVIEDPFYRTNEKDQQWIELEDWEYRTIFSVGSNIIIKDKIMLDFQGLDTYADVFLNDSLILEANNMFRDWQVDVTEIVRRGENELHIYFHSPIKKTAPIYDNLRYTLPVSSNDQAEKKLSVFSRKAPYHFGWDWGPRFVTSGIWRPIVLKAWNRASLEDVTIEQKMLTDGSAEMLAHVQYMVSKPFVGEVEILVDGESVKTNTVELVYGHQTTNFNFSVSNPKLWWPNGMGAQNLYEIDVLLKSGETTVDRYKTRLGLRTIELVQEDDRHGSSFYFKVNGKPVFAKGANYIPQDNFLPRVPPERYEHILQSAVDAHMNMVRVWGGGIYENDIFYDLCDEKGLLVWQDFMFSCAMYPGDSAFLENVKAEAEQNVKRLSSHPSMALWCGNNEILMKWYGWRNNSNEEGNQVPLWTEPDDSIKIVKGYNDLFRSILPDVVRSYGRGVPFWESSPSSKKGSFADWKTGDAHYWGVWWGQEPFEAYRKNTGRFMSEYGFQSFPELATIKTFTKEGDWDIYSEVMEAHQRSSIGNKTIASYMSRHFKEPKDFENYLYISQLLQAEGVKVAMEAHRIKKPYNMGSLVWQLDDCWPAASWSGIDYYGRWKALHYCIKKSFSEVIVAFEADENEIRAYVVSDRMDELKGTLILNLLDLGGKKLFEHEKKIKVAENGSELVWKSGKKDLLEKWKPEEVILTAKLIQENEAIVDNTFLFVPHKALKLSEPTIRYDFIEKDGKLFVELNCNKVALGVSLKADDRDIRYSENYFSLVPKEIKFVEIIGNAPEFEIKDKLTVKSLFDSYEP
jgi:beta-mannosidase